MAVLLLLFTGTIALYWFLTDSDRVRVMAEKYLSEMIHGRVTVHKARLSVFEGLRLEGVEMYLDSAKQPGSRLLSARMFQVKASARALLRGRLEASQILAIQPVIYLCENVDENDWNFRRLISERRGALEKPDQAIPPLPELLLRGGSVEYSRIQDGRHFLVGKMSIDGQLTPDPSSATPGGRYKSFSFEVEGRAPGEAIGPRVHGSVDLDRPAVEASLQGLEFDKYIRAMLPLQVQQWCDAHQVRGSVRVPRCRYSFKRDGRPVSYEIEIQLERGQLSILPQEVMAAYDSKGPKRPPYLRASTRPTQARATQLGAYERMRRLRPGFYVGQGSGCELAGLTWAADQVVGPVPIHLRNVSGRFVFSEDSIRFTGVNGQLEGNTVCIDGRIDGYKFESSGVVRVVANNIRVPRRPRYLNILPREARVQYEKFRPQGAANLVLELRRDRSSGPIEPSLWLELLDGEFCFDEFKYPLREIRGGLKFSRDPKTKEYRVDLIGIRGKGIAGSRNADREVHVDGWISPLNRNSRVKITVRGDGIRLDRPLRSALPPDAQEALALFDRHVLNRGPSQADRVVPVELFGNFRAELNRGGDGPRKLTVDVYLDILEAAGAFASFPYPLQAVKGHVEVHPNRVVVSDITGSHGKALMKIDGHVDFGRQQPVSPSLNLEARNVPVDQVLLGAFAPEQRQWLEKLQVNGTIDHLKGRIFRDAWAWDRRKPALRPGDEAESDDIDFDLKLSVKDGTIWPVEGTPLATNIKADLRLTRSELRIDKATGQRGQAELTAKGLISWPRKGVHLSLNVGAKDLFAGPIIRAILPDDAQQWWDQLRPAGVADVRFAYDGDVSGEEGSGGASPHFDLTVRPKSLAVTPVNFPWAMDIDCGELHVTPGKTELKGIVLRHGEAAISLKGDSTGGNGWTLTLSGRKLRIEDDLRRAVPKGIRDFIDAVKLRGDVSFEVKDLKYQTASQAVASGKPVGPAVTSYIFFNSDITLADGSMDVGVPLTGIDGSARLGFDIRNGDLYWMAGNFKVPALQLAGRKLTGLECQVVRPEQKADRNDPDYRFTDLHAKIAGGDLVISSIDLSTPANGPATYTLLAVLKDVDIPELVGEKDPRIKGVIRAGSLGLNGKWGDPNSRRGRGEIIVEGKELYRVPVVFGLLQVANLSLPIKSPFNEATARYIIEGAQQRVTLESLELVSSNTVMQGRGYLDFSTMRVEMRFNTESRNWPTVPIIGPIQRQLLEIRVSGRIQSPKFSSGAMSTFTTTMDRIVNATQPEAKAPTPPKRRKK